MRRAQIDVGSQPVRNLATNPSFETSAPGGTVTVNTNLCTNPTFGTNTANYTTISSSITRVTDQGGDGHVAELTQTVSGGARNSAVWIFATPQTAGTYSVSFDMKGTDASFTNVRSFLYDNATASIIGGSLATPLNKDGNYNRYSFTFTAPTTFDRVYMEVLGTAIPLGTKAWLDRVLIQLSHVATPYFDGSTPAAGDFTYAWSGTAHASTSLKRGITFPSQLGSTPGTDGVTFAVQSGEWAALGSKSLRLIPLARGNNYTYMYLNSTSLPNTLVRGRTYTFLAKLRMLAPQSGTLHANARKIGFDGGSVGTQIWSAQAPNTAGVHDLRVTFKVPEVSTYKLLSFMNGSIVDDVWYDSFMLVEGEYTGGYVDGSQPFAKWDGTAHASTSVGYPPSA